MYEYLFHVPILLVTSLVSYCISNNFEKHAGLIFLCVCLSVIFILPLVSSFLYVCLSSTMCIEIYIGCAHKHPLFILSVYCLTVLHSISNNVIYSWDSEICVIISNYYDTIKYTKWTRVRPSFSAACILIHRWTRLASSFAGPSPLLCYTIGSLQFDADVSVLRRSKDVDIRRRPDTFDAVSLAVMVRCLRWSTLM